MVSTNALLGHTLDHTTSKFIVPLCNTFYDNMTNLSRSWRRFCGIATIFQTFRSSSAHVGQHEHHLILADTHTEIASIQAVFPALSPCGEYFLYRPHSDVPSLQRTLVNTKSTDTDHPRTPAIAYEHSMAQYRAMRSLPAGISTSSFPRYRCDQDAVWNCRKT